MFYYALHHALPETERFRDGKRNCATFLVGTSLYAVTHALLMNAKLLWGALWDSAISALFIIWMADASTMAYTYRSYYGRSILHEFGSDDDQRNWVYDEAKHKYRRPTAAETARALKEQADALREQFDKEDAARRTELVRKTKERIRAARTIQRWWRGKLYNPPNGILYLRTLRHFESL
jgi:hypothetical protein